MSNLPAGEAISLLLLIRTALAPTKMLNPINTEIQSNIIRKKCFFTITCFFLIEREIQIAKKRMPL